MNLPLPIRIAGLLSLLGLGLISTGCHSIPLAGAFAGEEYRPENVYSSATNLPPNLKRVAVLPLIARARQAELKDACESLDPLVTAALLKTQKFEVTRISEADSKTITGQSTWTGEEELPENFFAALNKSSGCDAVFFCQLTTFRGYAPLAIGWRMKLVDVHSRQILWAGDEVFDAGQNNVKNGAQRYQAAHIRAVENGDWAMENSPCYFGQYTLAKLLDTLPAR
ncbi:MAG TPA: hypothetical protein VK327_01495 [Candidatus Paceibacterota bacterium]|nr:hypothetical protein [Candidatus Paceibacterota bacterium]